MEIGALHCTVCMVEKKINLQQNVRIIDIFNLVFFYMYQIYYVHMKGPCFAQIFFVH